MDFDMIGNAIDSSTIDEMAQHQSQSVPMATLLNNAPPTPTHQHAPMTWNVPSSTASVLPTLQALHPPPESSPSPSSVLPPSSQVNSTLTAADVPPIEPTAVIQCGGGLRYAEFCKEQAREKFKERKKNELMQRGEFDTMKRRKKGDTSMTPRQKYLRRLRMNQDSAAAARYAQEVYVQTLEKLVSTTEVEKRALIMELDQLRSQNAQLQQNVTHFQSSDGDPDNNNSGEAPVNLKSITAAQLAKLVDMFPTPADAAALSDPDFAQNMGIQPAPAV